MTICHANPMFAMLNSYVIIQHYEQWAEHAHTQKEKQRWKVASGSMYGEDSSEEDEDDGRGNGADDEDEDRGVFEEDAL